MHSTLHQSTINSLYIVRSFANLFSLSFHNFSLSLHNFSLFFFISSIQHFISLPFLIHRSFFHQPLLSFLFHNFSPFLFTLSMHPSLHQPFILTTSDLSTTYSVFLLSQLHPVLLIIHPALHESFNTPFDHSLTSSFLPRPDIHTHHPLPHPVHFLFLHLFGSTLLSFFAFYLFISILVISSSLPSACASSNLFFSYAVSYLVTVAPT